MNLEQRLIRAVRNADLTHQKTGGGTNHYVRDCLLPSLVDEGLAVVEGDAGISEPKPSHHQCDCGRSFTTAQGLGLHFKKCSVKEQVDKGCDR